MQRDSCLHWPIPERKHAQNNLGPRRKTVAPWSCTQEARTNRLPVNGRMVHKAGRQAAPLFEQGSAAEDNLGPAPGRRSWSATPAAASRSKPQGSMPDAWRSEPRHEYASSAARSRIGPAYLVGLGSYGERPTLRRPPWLSRVGTPWLQDA